MITRVILSFRRMVASAFSYTGRYVTQRLLDQGVSVRTLTNHPDRGPLFAGRVPAAPLEFSDPEGLCWSMEGAGVLYNTCWVRFGCGQTTFDQAVANSKALFDAAAQVGVGRFVHFWVSKASPGSRGYPTSVGRGRWRRY